MQQPADDWYLPPADRASWKRGASAFGFEVQRNTSIEIGTQWRSPNLWMVRAFDLPGCPLKRPVLRIAYDDDATVYVNGVKAFTFQSGNNMRHTNFPFPAYVAAGLKPTGNVIAIHATAKNAEDSQYVDAGIGEESIEW
jgi:hypothetical protein